MDIKTVGAGYWPTEVNVIAGSCLAHPEGKVLSSDWSVNSFVMIVSDKFFSQKFLSKVRLKKFVINNHYKTIYRPVRTESSSWKVSKMMANHLQ